MKGRNGGQNCQWMKSGFPQLCWLREVILGRNEKRLLGNYRFLSIARVKVGFTDDIPLVPVILFAGKGQFERWAMYNGDGLCGSGSTGVAQIEDNQYGVHGIAVALHNPTDEEISTTVLIEISKFKGEQ